MAIVWQKKVLQKDGTYSEYQIRSAGKSLRLYRNNVLHTQFNPQRIVTGDIWELILIASLNIPRNSRVLVLGAGGGAAVNLLQHFVGPRQIDVVDLDPTMLYLCKRFFLTQNCNVNLIESDAKLWLEQKSRSHKKYDLVIEDLFGELKGQPIKSFQLDTSWFNLLCSELTLNGRLVINFESSKELMDSPILKTKSELARQSFKSLIKFSSPRFQNRIAMFARKEIHSSDIRRSILGDSLLRKQSNSYYMRSLWVGRC